MIYDNEYSDEQCQTDNIFVTAGVRCSSLENLLSSKEKLDAYLSVV